MPFPAVKRVVYKKNLLDEVVCQVRFPPILKIDTETPAAFQEMLRSAYPNLTEAYEVLFDLRAGSPQGSMEELQKVRRTRDSKNYEFVSEDNKWKINLTKNFLALSTKEYVRWEDFISRFEKALLPFIDVYKPADFTRVGLRYIDVVVRSRLGLDGVDWNELIQEYILGVLAVNNIKGKIRSYENIFQAALEGKGVVRVSTKTVQSSESGEHCYIIDSDFFESGRIKHEAVLPILSGFHGHALNLFRWCIKDKLHDAMKGE